MRWTDIIILVLITAGMTGMSIFACGALQYASGDKKDETSRALLIIGTVCSVVTVLTVIVATVMEFRLEQPLSMTEKTPQETADGLAETKNEFTIKTENGDLVTVTVKQNEEK